MNINSPEQIVSFLLGQREIQIIRLEQENKRLNDVLSLVYENMDESLAQVLVDRGIVNTEYFSKKFGAKSGPRD